MKPSKPNTIEAVVHGKLCNTCGACSVACPVNAITYKETVGGHVFPVIDDELCTNCGLCLNVCAGKADNPKLLNALPANPFQGECREAWVGRSNDDAVYRAGQSGGVVTQLLINLLESGEVDACAVVNMQPGNPPRAVPFLARNREDVMTAQKSKYCPVPLLQVLREAKETNSRIAIVGLSCHLHGLKLLEDVIDLKAVVKYKIGLICAGVMSCASIDYLVNKTKSKCSISDFRFRDKTRTGYPGDVTVRDERDNVSIIPKSERMAIKDFFTPARCRVCFDKMNVLADVTVGDPWGLQGVDKQNGESVVIARTETGSSLITNSLNKGTLTLRKVNYEDVVQGQKIDNKSREWRTYCELWQAHGQELPGFSQTVISHVKDLHVATTSYRFSFNNALRLDRQHSRGDLICKTRRILTKRKCEKSICRLFKLLHRALRKIRIPQCNRN